MRTCIARSLLARATVLVALLSAPTHEVWALAEENSESTAIAALRAELEALRLDYQQRIDRLEKRIAELELGASAEKPPAPDIADLRAAALDAAGGQTQTAAAPDSQPTVGGERNLNRFNPEISATGIFMATSSDERDEFELHGAELDIQSALDPFTRTRFVIGFGHGGHDEDDELGEEDEHGGGGVHVEEGYVTYSALPGGLELMAGRFKQRFGALNRRHIHALPQTTYPLAYQTFFGDEGLAQTGLSFTWLLPRPWASANEITFEVTNSENEEAFSGEDFDDFSALLKIKNFWEIGDASYFELGLSGVTGETAWGGDSRVFGTDLTYNWQPPSRAKYREITWRTELLLSQRDDPLGIEREAWGGYSYLEGLLRRNLYAGVRYDIAEDPLDPSESSWGIVPYLTWWQSEYVRLRAEYSYVEDDLSGASDDQFTLQLVWAAGPHKHESY
jgi:hypothetical protein